MPRLERSAVIPRDPATVWDFLTHRENSPLIVPGLVRVWDIHPRTAGIGQRWRFEFKLLELPIEGSATMTAFDPGRSFEFETGSALKSRWTYRVESAGSHALVTVAVEYTLPEALASSRSLNQLRDARLSELLQNLAARLAPAS